MIYIMHLSDLHIATNAEWNNMKECLLRELQNKMKSVPEGKKLLVITGDFHVFGQKDFSEAEKFISELIQKTGLQKKKDVFVVPGNHDICYSDDKEEKARQVSIIKSVILDNDDIEKEEVRTLLQNNFANYSSFCRNLGLYTSKIDPASVHVQTWRGKLNLLHINTAIAADGNQKRKKEQILDYHTLGSDEIRNKLSDPLGTIALGHNSFYDLKKHIQNKTAAVFSQTNVCAYLCGDQHRFTLKREHKAILLNSKFNPTTIPNIVCGRCSTDGKDNYSDFGFYLHCWDEDTGYVDIERYYWEKSDQDTLHTDTTEKKAYRIPKTGTLPGAPTTSSRMNISRLQMKTISDLFDSLRNFSSFIRKQYVKDNDRKVYNELFSPVEVEENGKEYPNLQKAVFDITNELQEPIPIVLTAKGGQGKSTQLMSLWKALENHKDAEGKHDCAVLFYNICDLIEKGNWLHAAINGYIDKSDDDCKLIIEDMKKPASRTKRHYFLILDGLDEIPKKSESGIYKKLQDIVKISNGYNNLQVIIAGRSNNLDLKRKTINMVLADLKPQRVKRWLLKYHPENCIEEEYECVSRNPMLLLLAYEVSEDMLSHNHSQRYVQKKTGFALRPGEVIWNYSEYITQKYCRQEDADRNLAQNLVSVVLPYIAYCDYYSAESNVRGITKPELEQELNNLGISDTVAAISLIDHVFSGIIRLEPSGYYKFEHRFFIDYYAMMYISGLIKELYHGKNLIDENIRKITDDRFFEDDEYYDLLLCTLPFQFGLISDYYEQTFLDVLDSFLKKKQKNDKEYNCKEIQVVRFLRAMFCYWTLQFYVKNSPCERSVFSALSKKTFDAMTNVVQIVEESRRIRINEGCLVFAFYVLSQTYRTGSIMMNELSKSALTDFEPDLNRSYYYACKAIDFSSSSDDITDGYNYLAKVFFAASERIKKGYDIQSNHYQLTDNDLIINFRNEQIFDYAFADHIPLNIANRKPGDALSKQEAIERIQCFDIIADDFFSKGAKNGCVFSVNNSALNEEMEQERKPADQRNFSKALSTYIEASGMRRKASTYSARKAVQLIAQRKAGINKSGHVCVIENADTEKTVVKAYELMRIAAPDRLQWGLILFYKGMIKINYGRDDKRTYSYTDAVRSAYDDFCQASTQFQRIHSYKHIPLLLEMIKTGLELTKITNEIRSKVKLTLRKAMEMYREALPEIVQRADGIIKEGQWIPAICVVEEYMDTLLEYMDTFSAEIRALSLIRQTRLCRAHIEKEKLCLQNISRKWYDV